MEFTLLPTKILIDKEGMIIGRYGGGGESHEKMVEKLRKYSGIKYKENKNNHWYSALLVPVRRFTGRDP